MPEDTIAAIATPLGEGGLAVIRLSGPHALDVADRCFAAAGRRSLRPSAAPSHTLHLGRIEHEGRPVDEVLLAVMRAPRTYTREDVVEISCHGGLLPAKLVLSAVLANGARLAEPGEFTRRAFLNGRLDLAQAEAVADIIHSRTELALAAAEEQLAGKLSQRIRHLREDLLGVLAHVEAQLDFPEDDLAPDTSARLLTRLREGQTFIATLLRTAPEGQILRRGVRAAIVGRPNVGKSSLLNQLLGHERAIVSPEPGTTRDTIEETANVRGLPVVFVDTAGLREADDRVEQEGVRRTHTAVRQAELVLHVLDASEPLQPEDERQLESWAGRKRLVVLNKSDRPARLGPLPAAVPRGLPVSCLTGAGIEGLKDAIQHAVWAGELRADMVEVMINARHQEALRRAREALAAAGASLATGATLELVALDLRSAVNAVGEVTGQTTTEDLLDRIFGEFCIGK
jgi:tRNA modification GTPase